MQNNSNKNHTRWCASYSLLHTSSLNYHCCCCPKWFQQQEGPLPCCIVAPVILSVLPTLQLHYWGSLTSMHRNVGPLCFLEWVQKADGHMNKVLLVQHSFSSELMLEMDTFCILFHLCLFALICHMKMLLTLIFGICRCVWHMKGMRISHNSFFFLLCGNVI